MRYDGTNRGGAAVGLVEELPRLEASIVRYLRLWCDGPEGKTEVWQRFCIFFGSKEANAHMDTFEQLMNVVATHTRRPLQRHQVQCTCVGGDENAFANFVVAAALGEREDAMLLASNFMRPDMAIIATNIAEHVGLTFSRMEVPGSGNIKFNQPNSPTKH